ncbi:uncharacterized protein LOC129910493 [Episyrphus balteatus]|uniref:uncharacterized protein LOC129910493 n=1 Tax=Episyrphus balteatus TaxID=286459 RepID=UPI002485AEBF|nr:uncharacterized protein LOC129910493 [Episyrphus balteatus]
MNQSQPSTMSTTDNRRVIISEPPQCDFYTIPIQTGNQVNYGYTQRIYVEPNFGWFTDFLRNIRQSGSLISAFFIFISGGFSAMSSITYGLILPGSHAQICWFIGIIIGSCISAILVNKVPKRSFYIVASLFIMANGILYTTKRGSVSATIAARYFNGIAIGYTLIPTILNGSEQSVKRFRGMNLCVEHIGLSVGALLSSVVGQIQLEGVCSLFCGILAFGSAVILTLESPVFYLRKNKEFEAVHVLRRLQRHKIITDETYVLLAENKSLLAEDLNRGLSVNIRRSWIPMIKMILFRCFVSMSSILPMFLTFFIAYGNVIAQSNNFSYTFYYMFLLMPLIGGLISWFSLDTIGRRIPSALALLICGVIFFVIAMSVEKARIYFLLIYKLLSGIIAPASTCYLSEAFSVSVKPFFILVAIVSENILQIVTSNYLISEFSTETFCFTLSALHIIYGILFFCIMPETKKTTLRDAFKKFQPTT